MVARTRLALSRLVVLAACAASLLSLGACVGYLDADAGADGATDTQAPPSDAPSLPVDGSSDAMMHSDGGPTDAAPNADSALPADSAGSTDSADSTTALMDGACPVGNYATQVVEAGPLLYLRFNESGGFSATDEMGKYNGTYPPLGISLGAAGALKSDPCNNAVDISDRPGIGMPPGADFGGNNSQFTVELWLRPDAVDSGAVGFVIDHNDYPPRAGWDVILQDEFIELELWDSTGTFLGQVGSSQTAVTPGAWHHVVAEYDETGAQIATLWVDNIPATQAIGPQTLVSQDAGWTIGSQNCVCSQANITGTIDELAIYPYLLSGTDVARHYHAAGY